MVYGSVDVFHECKFSLLRLLTVYEKSKISPPEIIIYTDKPDQFPSFGDRLVLHIREIRPSQIRQWRGKIDFIFRPKIEMLLDCVSHYTGKLLYTDSDTYCLQPLEPLFDLLSDSSVILHKCEGSIGNPYNLHIKKWKGFLRRQTKSGLSAALKMSMWNAGTIGFTPVQAPLLQEVLSTTDEVHRKFPKHTVEQFAFCYTFQKHHLQLEEAEPFLFHYWNLKEFRVVLKHFFQKYEGAPLSVLMEKSALILPENIVPDKVAYGQIPSLNRRIKRWLKKDWKIDPYLQLLD
jgi:hypothetical protein